MVDNVEQVPTKFGPSPPGSFGTYQLPFQESNFTVTSPFDPKYACSRTRTRRSTFSPSYPSFPLDDLNDGFVLPVPETLADAEKEFKDVISGIQ